LILRLRARSGAVLHGAGAAVVLPHYAAGPGTVRQKELIDSALASVGEALSLSDQEEVLDIIAPLFRAAVNALGEITGEVFTADILEVMFSKFCVGK
jgi:tRNA modification GTPase